MEKKDSMSRRNFLKTASAVSVGSFLTPLDSFAEAQATYSSNQSPQKIVPTRPFGNTGVNVPILCLGSAFGRSSNLLLKQSINMGVLFWETAAVYAGGNAELAIGDYFEKFPEDRKEIFLGTKSYSVRAGKWSKDLDNSLKRMKTSHIDIYFVHAITDADYLVPPHEDSELWAKKAKSDGKIRFFGFSTHSNVEDNLMKASKFGWIDGIMFSYNFRTMQSEKMKRAIDACTKAGIGLIAMKTQASGYMGYTKKITPDNKEQALFNQLAKSGMTFEQAKLKAIWDDDRVASITSGITNMTILNANVAAAVDDKRLTSRDKKLMNQYARYTASHYCTGCASICETQLDIEVPVCDIMRFLMYARCYGELENAKSHYNDIPLTIRKQIAHIDYKKAERKCPRRIEIGRLMREASTELA